MKKQALAIVVVALVAFLGNSAFAGNNPRIDQALMETLAEKQVLKAKLNEHNEPKTSQVNSRYRAVEILEMGDELGGFATSQDQSDTASE